MNEHFMAGFEKRAQEFSKEARLISSISKGIHSIGSLGGKVEGAITGLGQKAYGTGQALLQAPGNVIQGARKQWAQGKLLANPKGKKIIEEVENASPRLHAETAGALSTSSPEAANNVKNRLLKTTSYKAALEQDKLRRVKRIADIRAQKGQVTGAATLPPPVTTTPAAGTTPSTPKTKAAKKGGGLRSWVVPGLVGGGIGVAGGMAMSGGEPQQQQF